MSDLSERIATALDNETITVAEIDGLHGEAQDELGKLAVELSDTNMRGYDPRTPLVEAAALMPQREQLEFRIGRLEAAAVALLRLRGDALARQQEIERREHYDATSRMAAQQDATLEKAVKALEHLNALFIDSREVLDAIETVNGDLPQGAARITIPKTLALLLPVPERIISEHVEKVWLDAENGVEVHRSSLDYTAIVTRPGGGVATSIEEIEDRYPVGYIMGVRGTGRRAQMHERLVQTYVPEHDHNWLDPKQKPHQRRRLLPVPTPVDPMVEAQQAEKNAILSTLRQTNEANAKTEAEMIARKRALLDQQRGS